MPVPRLDHQVTILRPAKDTPVWNFFELWAGREVLVMLVWRLLKVRYKNTAIGAAWAIIQPFSLMIVFTIFFGFLTRVPSDGIPYALFVYCGLVMWQFVAQCFTQGSESVVANSHLVTKIYFPRMALPVAVALATLVDWAFGLPALIALVWYYDVAIGWQILALPLFLLIAALTALGLSFIFSSLYVVYRDVAHLLPFLSQLWMFMSPVIYPASLVPASVAPFYALNPMVTVIDGNRWIFAGGAPPDLTMLLVSVFTAIIVFVAGFAYFRRRELLFADLV